MAEPKVSVCIPTFNKSRFLRESIQSVLSQSFADFELAVIDDASTDDTPAVVASFQDQRIRHIRHERNIGLQANFNECLRTGQCEFIVIFHDDDVMLGDLLGREFEVLKSAGDVVLVHCGAQLVDENGTVYSVPTQKWPSLTRGLDFVRRYWGSRECGVTMPSVMLRRSVALRLGGFNEELKYSLDADLWQRMAFEGKVAFVDEILLSNRIHSGQTTSRILKDRLQMLVERHKYATATRELVARHHANIDSTIQRKLTAQVAADLTDLRSLGEPLGGIFRYLIEAVRRRPRSLLSLRLNAYLLLACMPGKAVKALKRLHGKRLRRTYLQRHCGMDCETTPRGVL